MYCALNDEMVMRKSRVYASDDEDHHCEDPHPSNGSSSPLTLPLIKETPQDQKKHHPRPQSMDLLWYQIPNKHWKSLHNNS